MSAVLQSDPSGHPADWLDRIGICASLLCLAQCLLVPVLLVAMAVPLLSFGTVAGPNWLHLAVTVLIVPVSLAAFVWGYRRHRDRGVLAIGLAGLSTLLAALVLELMSAGTPWSLAGITAGGGTLLILGHWGNLRSGRRVCPT